MVIGKIRSAIVAAAVCFAATSASAAIVSTNNFETAYDGFSVDEGDITSLVSLTNYVSNSEKPSGSAPAPFSDFGYKYLSLDTDDTMVWRNFTSQSSDVYFDSYVKMTPCVGDIDYTNDAKFVVFLNADTNLCVISGTAADDRTTVTNVLDTASQIEADTWHRLTVRAETSDGVFAFGIFLDGTLLSSTVGSPLPSTNTFYSLFAGTSMSNVGLKGTGAIDDLVVRTTVPVFSGSVNAKIGGEDFATLEAAIAAAGADDVVVLQSNNTENITLTEGQTFKLKPNGFTYNGTVTSASGYRLEISDPDANGIITYSQAPYKPSININFTYSGSGLTTSADVGLAGYEVPGTSWNNFAAANNTTYSTVNAVDATGAASVMSGVSVAISGTRGSHYCSGLTAESNPLYGYIDDNASYPTPTVTVTGIPYHKYKVIVYHSTDTENVPFGYDTINGINYTYVNNALAEGTTAWGDSGASNSANAISEGGNVLLTGELFESTLTVVGHRAGGATNARGCIAAIQIVEVPHEVGENDLEIPVSGDTTYTVSEGKTLSGTVYITGSGTLTLAGSAKISAATIEIGADVTLNANATRLDGTAFTGAGTVAYDGVVPPTGKGWTDSTAWRGTVWIKDKSGITGNNDATTGVQPNSLGNRHSKVKFSGVSGWIEAPIEYNPEIVLENAGYDYALKLTNGNSPNTTYTNRATIVKKLSGGGTLCCGGTSDATPVLKVYDASGFYGSINTVNADNAEKTGLVVVFCEEDTTLPDTLVAMFINTGMKRTIYVASGKEVTLDSMATWTAETGFMLEGTLIANGTLASSHATKAVSGSGTVVFDGLAPSLTGDAWWKNTEWQGTLFMKNRSDVPSIDLSLYGNSGSTVKFSNVTGWFKQGNSSFDTTLELDDAAGTAFTLRDGWTGNVITISNLKGSGTFYGKQRNASTPQVTVRFNNFNEFTGKIQLYNKRVAFGSGELPTFVEGQICVTSGAVVENKNSANAGWWAVGGIKVDGELRAPSLGKFGGGTSIYTGDNGVFTLVSNSDIDDMNNDYARIQGAGILKYEGTNYRTISTNNFPTAMVVENNLSAGLIHRIPGLEVSIGSISGNGKIRSDWDAGNRNLRILQAKDTTYSGVFDASIDRIGTVTVARGVSSTGTLTLSAEQTATNSLVVETGASVNLTGKWVGDVTVEGELSGNGIVDGSLTFSEGAELGTTGLAVTGTTTINGAVNVYLPAGTKGEVTLLSSTGKLTSTATFTVYVGGTPSTRMKVKTDGNVLKVVPPGAIINIF